MLGFGAEWLREFDLRKQDIAAAIIEGGRLEIIEIHVLAEDRLLVYSLVVERDFIIGDVIINDHFARPNDNHLSHLLRIEPAYVNIGDDLRRIFQVQKYHIIDPILHVGHTLARDRNWFRISKPILDDADVMRSEVPQGVDIRANAPQVEALTVNVTDVA